MSRARSSEELSRIAAQNLRYHMQIPEVLCWTVEEDARIFARLEGASALLGVEVNQKSIRLQRPLGPKGWEIYYEEIKHRWREGCAILAAGLFEEDLPRFRQETGFQGDFLKDSILFLNLDSLDPELRGNAYKTLRQSVRRVEELDVVIGEYIPKEDVSSAKRLYESWRAIQPRQGTDWIPDFLGKQDGFSSETVLTLSARRREGACLPAGRLSAVASSLILGSYAYMMLAIREEKSSRVMEILDYKMLCALKEKGVRRVDWGVSPREGLIQYKKKFGKMEEVVIHTAWLP